MIETGRYDQIPRNNRLCPPWVHSAAFANKSHEFTHFIAMMIRMNEPSRSDSDRSGQ